MPTKLCDTRLLFGIRYRFHWNRSGRFTGIPEGFTSISSSNLEACSRRQTNHTETEVVVAIRRVVVVAIGGATVVRVVVPRTTANEPEVPIPPLVPQKNQGDQRSAVGAARCRHG
jgi:hypothetical protein